MAWLYPRAAAALLVLGAPACQRIPLDDDPVIVEDTDEDSGGPPTSDTSAAADDGYEEPQFGCEPSVPTTCPMGQKCSALSAGGSQNHFECVHDDGILPAGDECTPAPGTGQDQCQAGTVCLASSADATLGQCLALCGNDSDCEPGLCTDSPFTSTPFCADPCDPLAPACPPGRSCMQAADRFICGMPLETDVGVNGESCDSINLRLCAEGFACITGTLVPGCINDACCTNVCDLGNSDAECASPTVCRPLFPQSSPGYELLGACYVPAA